MTRLIAALALASFSFMASAADKPLPVTVSNADPILVRDYRTPYQLSGFRSPCQSNQACTVTFNTTVPDGKRLVVTYFTGFTDVTNGTVPNCVLSSSLGGDEFASVRVIFSAGTVSPTHTRMHASHQVLAYFGPGETPSLFCGLIGTSDTFHSPFLSVGIAGYYEAL